MAVIWQYYGAVEKYWGLFDNENLAQRSYVLLRRRAVRYVHMVARYVSAWYRVS